MFDATFQNGASEKMRQHAVEITSTGRNETRAAHPLAIRRRRLGWRKSREQSLRPAGLSGVSKSQ